MSSGLAAAWAGAPRSIRSTSAATRSGWKARRTAQRLRPRRRRSPGGVRSHSLRRRAPAAVPRCGVILEPGVPAEAEGAVDQGLAADRDFGRRREPPSATLRQALVESHAATCARTSSRKSGRISSAWTSPRSRGSSRSSRPGGLQGSHGPVLLCRLFGAGHRDLTAPRLSARWPAPVAARARRATVVGEENPPPRRQVARWIRERRDSGPSISAFTVTWMPRFSW